MTERRSRTGLILAAILLLALGLRLIQLGGRTLWYDEAFAVLFAEKGWSAMLDGTITPVEGGAADVHPLLYYVTLHHWMDLFGESPAAVRLCSVLAGVATVGAVFLLARDWFDERTALVAALLTAAAPFHVQYSQETRMYALLALVLVLATWLYWRVWQHDRWWDWLAFGLLAGAAMYVQQLAAFYLLALGLLPLLARDRRRLVKTGLAALLALALYAPWLLYLPDQMGKLRQYWVQRPNVLHLWLALRSFVSVNLDFAAAWWLPTFLLAAVLTIFLLYRAAAALRSGAGSATGRQGLTWALWLSFMPMILMWIASYVVQPVFLPRALLPSALMFYVALAWLLTRGEMPRPVVGLLGAWWGIIIVFGLVTHYRWDTFPNPPFDRAADYVEQHRSPNDQVVHGNKITMLPMVYYARGLAQRYVRDIPGSGSDTLAVPTQKALGLLADPCAAAAAGGAPRVWYVAFRQLEREMADLIAEDASNRRYDSLGWLREHYASESVTAFEDLELHLFSDPQPGIADAACPSE